MRSTRGLAALFVVAAAIHLAGVVFGSAFAAGVGVALASGVLAVHVVTGGHAPRNVWMLLVAGLIFLAAAVVIDVWDWQQAGPGGEVVPATVQASRRHVIWVAIWRLLGIGLLVAAVVRLPPDHRRGLLLALGVIGAPTILVVLLTMLVFAFLGPDGSFTDVLVAGLAVAGGVGWLTLRMKRWLGGRIPVAGIVLAFGLTALAFPLWWAVTSVMRAVADTGCPAGTICVEATRVVESPYVGDAAGAAVAAVALGGTALIVLGCAGVRRRQPVD